MPGLMTKWEADERRRVCEFPTARVIYLGPRLRRYIAWESMVATVRRKLGSGTQG
jgi:hypothetical protein